MGEGIKPSMLSKEWFSYTRRITLLKGFFLALVVPKEAESAKNIVKIYKNFIFNLLLINFFIYLFI